MTVDAGDDVTIFAGNSTTLNSTVTNGTGTLTYAWSPSANLFDPAAPDPVASPTTTTTYTLVVTDENDCEATGQVTVTVETTGGCAVQAGSGTYSVELPPGQTGPSDMAHFAVFTKNGDNTYVAYNPSCDATRSATFSDSISFLVNSGELKMYQPGTPSLANSPGENQGSTQSTESENANSGLQAFPNPVQDELSFSFTAATTGKTEVQIVNNLGQLVLSRDLGFPSGLGIHEIDVRSLEDGVYYLKVEGVGTVRFVVN